MSSYHTIVDIRVPPAVIRDFRLSFALSGSKTIDLWQEYQVVGLDWMVHNRGASSLTVKIDESDAITVNAGDTYSESGVKFSLIKISSTVPYDLVVMGVHLRSLAR